MCVVLYNNMYRTFLMLDCMTILVNNDFITVYTEIQYQ